MTQVDQFKLIIDDVLTILKRTYPQWESTASSFSRDPRGVFEVVIKEISSNKEYVFNFNRSEINTYLKLNRSSLPENLSFSLSEIAQKEFAKG